MQLSEQAHLILALVLLLEVVSLGKAGFQPDIDHRPSLAAHCGVDTSSLEVLLVVLC